MASRPEDIQTFSLVGEIVEILEERDQRFAKIVFNAPVVLDVTHHGSDSLHLGDRVAVHGWMGVEKEVV
jgi:hypothetical protein